MNETQEKYFGKLVPKILIVGILIVNLIIHAFGIEYGFLVFLGNIMFFTMEGNDLKKKLLTVLCGGSVGLLLGYAMIMGMAFLSSLGLHSLLAFAICLLIVLIILIQFHPKAPIVLNNVGFLYMTCATAFGEIFIQNFGQFFATFLIGNTIFNLVSCAIIVCIYKYTLKKIK